MVYQILAIGVLFQLIYYPPFGKWLFAWITGEQKRQNILVLFQRVAVIVLFLFAGYVASPTYSASSLLEIPENPWFYLLTLISCLAVFLVTNRYLKKSDNYLKNLHLDYAR